MPRIATITLLPIAVFPLMAAAQETLHVTQQALNDLVASGQHEAAFIEAFEVGDELFEHPFTAEQGVGANVGNGQRFTLVPRADLDGEGQWAQHLPMRATGPNAQSCTECHNQPVGDGAGAVALNNVRDPQHSGDIGKFIIRQPPHVFGLGALQLLSEEMTTELKKIRKRALRQARKRGAPVRRLLSAKGVDFGALTAYPDGSVDTSDVSGVDADLVVKSMDWKGSTASIRQFVRDAGHNEIGMQAVELVGLNVDGDGDQVVNELGVGDITAITIYQAGQPRPVTRVELAGLGLIDPLTEEELAQIERGEQKFASVGCNECHRPSLFLDRAVFSEPSQHPDYRDQEFPSGQLAASLGVDPAQPIRFDLTEDMPDNLIELADGSIVKMGNFEKDGRRGAVVELFGDLKRHDMGAGLAESIDEVGTGASNFITKELWGVGSTPPYLHDGRATTLTEAIEFHGGEGVAARSAFRALQPDDREAIIAYLENLVLFKLEEEE